MSGNPRLSPTNKDGSSNPLRETAVEGMPGGVVGTAFRRTERLTDPPSFATTPPSEVPPQYLRHPDKRVVMDPRLPGVPLTVDRILSTKPLRHEVSTRPGPGGRKLSYFAGDTATRLLNEIFGYDGWNLEIISSEQKHLEKDAGSQRYTVLYEAKVRITLVHNGAFREDMGYGDASDRSLANASAFAMKGSITDAIKRTARHFGEKLGNALYSEKFCLEKCPQTLQEALQISDKERQRTFFKEPAPFDTMKISTSIPVSHVTPKSGMDAACNSTSADNPKKRPRDIQVAGSLPPTDSTNQYTMASRQTTSHPQSHTPTAVASSLLCPLPPAPSVMMAGYLPTSSDTIKKQKYNPYL